ncbi:hypothetical protein FGB62_191g03 [Gracilaria domingensis]|nr:hypothetical protein FGB62_191g03 [Gracilaria domingensis]
MYRSTPSGRRKDATRDLDVDLSHQTICDLGLMCHPERDLTLSITQDRLNARVDTVADNSYKKPAYTFGNGVGDLTTLGLFSGARFTFRHLTRLTAASFARSSEEYQDLQLAIACNSMAKAWLSKRFERFGKDNADRRMEKLVKAMGNSHELDHEEMRRMTMLMWVNKTWLRNPGLQIDEAACMLFCNIAREASSWVKHVSGKTYDEFSYFTDAPNVFCRRMVVTEKKMTVDESVNKERQNIGISGCVDVSGPSGNAELFRAVTKETRHMQISLESTQVEAPRPVQCLSDLDHSNAEIGPRDLFFIRSRAFPHKFSVQRGRQAGDFTCRRDPKGVRVDIAPSALAVRMAEKWIGAAELHDETSCAIC